MKKTISVALAALLMMSLAACGVPAQVPAETQGVQTQPQTTEVQTQPAAAQPTEDQTQPASAPVSQEDTRELEYEKDGKTLTLTAKLHQGEGYSLYVPQNWYLETEYDDGVLTETWEGRGEAELEVRHLGKMELSDAYDWIAWEEDDFTFAQDEKGNMIGDDREREDGLEVRFFSDDAGQVYALSLKYDLRRPDGWDSALRAAADTFQLAP